ncbi:MAG: RsmB/NOP family class I SAM-dependent RNA methyltransferase [Verrucomicrobiota bacterium]
MKNDSPNKHGDENVRAPQRLLKIAAEIITKSDREHPADSVLRVELKRQTALSRSDTREISRTVFTYFRWFGWLDPQKPLAGNIFVAQELAERFTRDPQRFSEGELLSKAIPAWAKENVGVSSEWLRALQKEPQLWLRTKRNQAARIAEALGYSLLVPNMLLSDAVQYRGPEDLFRSPEFQDGDFELQDISSQAVGVICAPKSGETWWDACAGEGGKLLHLSELMGNKGLIWASDRAEWRLKRLKQRTARAKVFNYRAALWDGGKKLPTKTKFDGVLVDAPCSGIGTWHRNPQARWTTSANDVNELAAIQRGLLLQVADSVKPGGKLIYSVCTLSREETTGVAEYFQKERKDFQPLEVNNPFTPNESARQLWFWPQDSGGNGMFVAAWKKV